MFIVRIPHSYGSSAAATAPQEREQDQLACLLLVGEDRRQVTIGKPACVGARAQGALDVLVAVKLGEVDRLGHLAPQPLCSRRGGVDQPLLRAVADLKERLLFGAAGSGGPYQFLRHRDRPDPAPGRLQPAFGFG
ncbi:MAG: hypothetical protein ACXVHK_22225 [Solirubrobacteraceae bacterium]